METGKRSIIMITVIIVVAMGAYFMGSVAKQQKKAPRNIGGMNIEQIFSGLDEGIAPDGPPSIMGKFIAVDGSQIIVEKVVGGMQNVERSKEQTSIQSLSDGGREQMREVRRTERENAEKEKIFVTISDKTIIMQSTDSNELEQISVQELDENKNVMIWNDESGSAVFILQNNMIRNNN